MSTKTNEASDILERVITDSIEAQARYDARDGRAPARQCLVYLRMFYATRQRILGYQTA